MELPGGRLRLLEVATGMAVGGWWRLWWFEVAAGCGGAPSLSPSRAPPPPPPPWVLKGSGPGGVTGRTIVGLIRATMRPGKTFVVPKTVRTQDQQVLKVVVHLTQ